MNYELAVESYRPTAVLSVCLTAAGDWYTRTTKYSLFSILMNKIESKWLALTLLDENGCDHKKTTLAALFVDISVDNKKRSGSQLITKSLNEISLSKSLHPSSKALLYCDL